MEMHTAMSESVFYILLSLRSPNHGYGIIQEVEEMTHGRVKLGAGTLYGAISTLLERGSIQLYSEDKESRKKKEYLITQQGREQFANEVERLKELLKNSHKMEG